MPGGGGDLLPAPAAAGKRSSGMLNGSSVDGWPASLTGSRQLRLLRKWARSWIMLPHKRQKLLRGLVVVTLALAVVHALLWLTLWRHRGGGLLGSITAAIDTTMAGVLPGGKDRAFAQAWWVRGGNTTTERTLSNIPLYANSEALYIHPDRQRDTRDPLLYCGKAPMYVDTAEAARRAVVAAVHPTPAISIIFVTKRPGGYDFVFNSLAQQTRKVPGDYELICVDELAPFRAERVRAQARALDINLVTIVPSKPRQERYSHFRFGIYNALNTGLLLSRGRIITILMDSGWLPDNYIERTLEFYADPAHERSLLAYPEWFFMAAPPSGERLHEPTSLHIFEDPWTAPPLEYIAGGKMEGQSRLRGVSPGYKRPQELVDAWLAGTPKGFQKQSTGDVFWEMSFCTAPWSAFEAIDGLEEFLDIGDDCHESNARLRAEKFGYDVWIDGNAVVQNIWHKSFEDSTLWNRYSADTNIPRFFYDEMGQINAGLRSAKTLDAQVDWRVWRELDCPLQVARTQVA